MVRMAADALLVIFSAGQIVRFLASDEAFIVNGSLYNIDGGGLDNR